jgi:hypothetical protein
MRSYLAVLALVAFVPPALGAEEVEALIKESLKLVGEMTAGLKAVKDKASAEAAVPKLKAIDERIMADLKKKEAELHKLSAEEMKQLQTRYKNALQTTMSAFGSEVKRIDKLPEAMAVLKKELSVFKQMDEVRARFEEAMVTKAKLDVRGLSQHLDVYKLNTGEYPKALAVLTEGTNPLLPNKESLLDPWGNPYQYDPDGPRNRGLRPDVWTVTPDKKVIGNWPEK